MLNGLSCAPTVYRALPVQSVFMCSISSNPLNGLGHALSPFYTVVQTRPREGKGSKCVWLQSCTLGDAQSLRQDLPPPSPLRGHSLSSFQAPRSRFHLQSRRRRREEGRGAGEPRRRACKLRAQPAGHGRPSARRHSPSRAWASARRRQGACPTPPALIGRRESGHRPMGGGDSEGSPHARSRGSVSRAAGAAAGERDG